VLLLGCWAAALGWAGKGRRAEIGKGKGRVEGLRFGNLEVWVKVLERDSNQIEFKLLNLNSNNQKKCSSMCATINSYILLTLF
jgi:hypothetical protein